MTNASNALRPATGDRRLRVRSAARSSDRKSINTDAAEAIVPKLSMYNYNTEIDDQIENDEMKAEENISIPLLKGTPNLLRIE